ncbi:MAG: DUF4129 domain-containing protein [Caldilineae bacterium]|nr:MAG: DUF4129 domain-containing protein [Caldilineae bacterium]
MQSLLRDLRFWHGISWRRNALFLALAGMEMSWLTLVFMSLEPRSWGASPVPYFVALFGIMVVLMIVAHFLSTRQVDSPLFELIVLGVIVVIGLVLVRLYVFREGTGPGLHWLRAAFLLPDAERLQTMLVLGTLAYLWWRGVTFLQREVSFFVVGYDFRKGVLALVVGSILYKVLAGHEAPEMVYVFFFFSLMAVALGRVEDKARVPGGESAFGKEWLGIVATSSALVLALSALVGLLWHRPTFAFVGRLLAPSGSVLGRYVEAVAVFLLSLLEPLFQWLIAFIRARVGAESPLLTPADNLPSSPDLFGDEMIVATGPPAWLQVLFNYVIPGLLLVLGLVVLVLWLERRRGRKGSPATQVSRRVAGVEREGLSGLVRRGMAQLRGWAGLVGQFGLGRRFYAAVSVRYIYANLQRLAAERGYPRHKSQTPNDFLPTLRRAFPGQDAALELITRAYNAVEYGSAPTDAGELERIRRAWQAVEQAARFTQPDREPRGR